MWDTFDQKFFFMAGSAAAFRENGEIRRIEKQHMKGLVADPAVKEAADAYTMQASLCFFYSIFIQFHTVGVAVVTCGDLP